MIVPGIAYFIIFNYAPLYGIQLAFKDFKYNLGITKSPWVGLEHFKDLIRDKEFWNVFKNTLIISFGKFI
jgi:putative aldouronate transport system permease protein